MYLSLTQAAVANLMDFLINLQMTTTYPYDPGNFFTVMHGHVP